jgi:hypothetical protein
MGQVFSGGSASGTSNSIVQVLKYYVTVLSLNGILNARVDTLHVYMFFYISF